jgi:hypothetical protein
MTEQLTTVTGPLIVVLGEDDSDRPAMPVQIGMRVILAGDALNLDGPDDEALGQIDAGRLVDVRPGESPLLIEWPGGARAWHDQGGLRAVSWPTSVEAQGRFDAEIERYAALAHDGYVKHVDRTEAPYVRSWGDLPEPMRAAKIKAMLTVADAIRRDIGLGETVAAALEQARTELHEANDLRHRIMTALSEAILSVPGNNPPPAGESILEGAVRLIGQLAAEHADGQDQTEEDAFYSLGASLGAIADRELRIAVAFMEGLSSAELETLVPAPAPKANLGQRSFVYDGRGAIMRKGDRVHRLSPSGREGVTVGTVVALLPEGASVRWGGAAGRPRQRRPRQARAGVLQLPRHGRGDAAR